MKIRLNGEIKDIDASASVETLVRENVDGEPRGLAVAVNDEVVPKSGWSLHLLNEDDRVEIVRATQGG